MNTYLDTAISVILIILIFSVVTYVVQELIAFNLQSRGKMLRDSITQLMSTTNSSSTWADGFFKHAEIASLRRQTDRLASYIPAGNFALAVMDMVAAKSPVARTNNLFNDVRSGLTTFSGSEGNLFVVVRNLADSSTDIIELQHKLEKWYNNYMDRVTGWYQSNTVKTIRVIAIVVTIGFNLNLIKITGDILHNSTLRGNLVGMAQGIADDPESITDLYTKKFEDRKNEILTQSIKTADSTSRKDSLIDVAAHQYTQEKIAALQSLVGDLSKTKLPLGWHGLPVFTHRTTEENFEKGLVTLAGWLITAGCISMGAPFWFNLLMQLVNVRRAGIKPTDNSGKKKS
jgi:hypothetical protein